MNSKAYKILSIVLVFILIISGSTYCISVRATEVIKNTINIADAIKNARGSGYEWNNVEKILTLDRLNLDTDDDYGLRLPKNCTVILKGDNYIKASKYGISLLGTVVFKGSGSLTVEAGEIGFYITSKDNTQKIRLLDGDYKIYAEKYGVYSEHADFSFLGDSLDISVPNDALAVSGRIVNLLGGKFSANSTVYASHALTLDSVNIEITSTSSALSAKNLYIENMSIDEYNGEASVSAKSTAKTYKDSIFFGEGVPAIVDYILLAALLIGVFAGIFGPALRKKKKAEALKQRLKEEGYITN